ncbi:MAG: hypothetical protein KKG09_08930, partial [Verrucomicrobia bacterium]|nr:hypothetical protein [Verrucomicrobiota bacterium]MBU4291940.1 hypothetical protein [Verrucomicrobiota bacterium]MBU4428954.1 hypothetical protein [Verrucomicrobiota bacterium]MBU4498112.1 hypothetical protein [Verrucomicrobiota bacterium]MCG2679363.1 hypothetical protein [Kiritimatiellia bacterium]
GYKGLTTCVERITHWVIRPTRRLFANALSALTKSEYCAIFAQYSGGILVLPMIFGVAFGNMRKAK